MLTSRFESIRMQEYQTFSTFYYEFSDIVNSSFNLRQRIPELRIVIKILRSLPTRLRPKVTAIEESKDADSIRIDELVGYLQTYEMTLPDSWKPKESLFKASKSEEKDFEISEKTRRKELAHITKQIKEAMKFYRRANRKQNLENGKKYKLIFKEKNKGFSKGKNIK